MPHPPAFNAAVVVKKTLRFRASAALTQANATITQPMILDLLCMADTAVSAYRLASSARIHEVRIWGPMAADLVPVTASIEYRADASTSLASPNFLKSDTSMGSAEPAYVSFKPPANSLATQWFGPVGGFGLFTLTGPINSIVDVHLSLVIQNGETPVAVANALVAATVGTVYCRGLDRLAAAATVLPPVSYTTA